MSDYHRSRDGRKWHHHSCTLVSRHDLPEWAWADNRSGEEIVELLAAYGVDVKACRLCHPERAS